MTTVLQLPDALAQGLLPPIETFPCPEGAHWQDSGVIRIVFPEFTCVCPKNRLS